MRNLLPLTVTIVLLGSLTMTPLPHARAADANSKKAQQGLSDGLDQELDELNVQGPEEAPPEPEAPYPGSAEDGFSATPSAPAAAVQAAPPVARPPSVKVAPIVSERPVKITDEGEYIYSTKIEKPTPSGRADLPTPTKTNEAGEFYYDTDNKPPAFSGRAGTETPININAKGEYFYPTEESPRSGSFSLRFGAFTPPKIQNPDNEITFEELYGSDPIPTLFVDYEWRLTEKVGHLALKFTSGLFLSSGPGRFANPDRLDEIPDTRFSFLTLPNQLTAIYRFQYAERQVLTPYLEGGAGYFTFAEFRDDGKRPLFDAAPVTVAAGGLNLLLDWIDPQAIRQLDVEWGVNHVWLTLDYRTFIGLGGKYDFTSQAANAGFLMEF